MLTGLLGIRVLVWVGQTVPSPPPPGVLESLSSVRVINDSATGDGFQLSFKLTKQGGADYAVMQSGALDVFNRIVIAVVMGVTPEVLIDGIITNQELSPSERPGQTTLTVSGKDVSLMMDLIETDKAYPNQSDSVIVEQVIGQPQYAMYGLQPTAVTTVDQPMETNRTPRQAETDLALVKRLALRNGYIFYVQPVTFGVNLAYFGPDVRAGLLQPALKIDMGHASNLRSLSFSQDSLAPVQSTGSYIMPESMTAIPIPAGASLRLPPLAARPVQPRRTRLLRQSGNSDTAQAIIDAVAQASNAPDAVTGSGVLDSIRYGTVLRARSLVGVAGAGYTYDGNYYVRRVTHEIEPRGGYRQSFSISREGTGAQAPVVLS